MTTKLILILLLSSSLYGIETELRQAITNRDHKTVQQLLAQQKETNGTRSAVQKIGRATLVTLYNMADTAEQEAKKDAESYANMHVTTRLVKVGCCASGFTYQIMKLAHNWKNYKNWTEIAIAIAFAGQGFCEFYKALKNEDAKNEFVKAQLITRSLKDLHDQKDRTGTVLLNDLENNK